MIASPCCALCQCFHGYIHTNSVASYIYIHNALWHFHRLIKDWKVSSTRYLSSCTATLREGSSGGLTQPQTCGKEVRSGDSSGPINLPFRAYARVSKL